MKRLHSFILKSFLGPLAFTFFICMFVLLMQFLWRYIDELVGKGLEWTVIAEFLFYVSATLVPMALPLAILLASIMTFGNMGENYELTAMKAAGISLQRIMQPLTTLVIIISISAFFFANYVMPVASLKTTTLLVDIKNQKPELILKEGIFTNDLPNFSIKVDNIDKETGMMYKLLIYDHRDKRGNTNVTVADSGTMVTSPDKQNMTLTLYSGNMYQDVKQKSRRDKNHPSRRIKFQEYETNVPLRSSELKRSNEDRYSKNYRMLNLKQLVHSEDSMRNRLDVERDRLVNGLLAKHYFKKDAKSMRKDSVRYEELLKKTKDADSLFKAAPLTKQLTSVSSALSFARKARENISRKENEILSQEKWIIKFTNEWHRKFTLPFACLIFFFIGAPLGAIIRKGGLGMPVIVSVLFFIFYYIISMTAERFAKELVLPPALGMWISSLIILPLGIILTYKATTDSAVFNIENYIDFFKKINPVKFFKKKNA
ncbi:LptF/LptG family permease [Marinifilum caeruleilacunae]|uniref:YjgP/YjgQ family permease n=1 Tax=Marinifilum caeruleilacunae TaxID=2499076 RepID=A0ABX1WTB8_9BACT|nr:LptF/LptG family permease [Marinifilum caeruleilacunae]NOU59349.1 YjgP/YjgQ family permease [Marinifilum caeruleilacunae]